jgi:hypothetical protein
MRRCFTRRSDSTNVVRWPSQRSKCRVALTMFMHAWLATMGSVMGMSIFPNQLLQRSAFGIRQVSTLAKPVSSIGCGRCSRRSFCLEETRSGHECSERIADKAKRPPTLGYAADFQPKEKAPSFCSRIVGVQNLELSLSRRRSGNIASRVPLTRWRVAM